VNGRDFTRIGMIGRGGSSKVYKVMAPNNRIFALKRVMLNKADPATVEGYINEIELLKRLSKNEHIIRLYDSETDLERNVLMMVSLDKHHHTAMMQTNLC
jgi:serine/threonine-protein kinase TTK/MPS1